MTKFLANENIPALAIRAARDAGFDVESIAEFASGSADENVLKLATEGDRVLLTFDKDFGRMAFKEGQDSAVGVVLLRPRLQSPDYVTAFMLQVLTQSIQWRGHFCVANEQGVRVVPLPAKG